MAKPGVFERKGFPARVGPIPFLGLAVLAQTGSSFAQQGIPVLGVFFARWYHLSLTGMGLTVSAATLGMMLCFTPMGVLADRLGPRRLLMTGSLMVCGILLATAQVRGFTALVVALFGFGCVVASIPAAGMKAVFSAFVGRDRGLPMGIRQTGVPLGAAFAAFLLPPLANRVGMPTLFAALAIMVLVVGMVFGGMVPAVPKAVGTRSAPVPWRQLARPLAVPALVAFLMAAGQYDVLTFSIPSLQRHSGISLGLAGATLAAAQIGGGVARVGFGLLSDRQGGDRTRFLMVAALLATILSLVVAFLPPHVNAWLLIGLWFVFGIGAVGWNALVATWGAEQVDPACSGVAMSIIATMVFVGAVVDPPIFGWVVDHSHHFAWGWGTLAASCGMATLTLGWSIRRGRRRRALVSVAGLSS